MAVTRLDTKPNVRFEDGILKWFNGDTFTYRIYIIPIDTNGQNIPVQDGDYIIARFYIDGENERHAFECRNLENMISEQPIVDTDGTEIVPANTNFTIIALEFTQDVTEKFEVGDYTYCIKYYDVGGERGTIAANQKAEVEQCH